jgi:hypothetical protein
MKVDRHRRHRQHGPGHGAALARPRASGGRRDMAGARRLRASTARPRMPMPPLPGPGPRAADRRRGRRPADRRGAVRRSRRGSRPGAGLDRAAVPDAGAAAVEDCAARLAERGIDCIDAPMSGGPLRARDGTMSLMVACADAVFARWHGVLQQLSSRLFRVGTAPGDGARTKLSTTCWQASTWPARPSRWRWPNGWAWTRQPRWR